jgi:hypothetical protein
MNDETAVTAVSDQVSCDLDDETAILNLKTGVYFTLNEVGTFLWARMQEPTTFGALRDSVLEHYEVDRDQCESDICALLEDMSEHGLVELGE